MNENARKNSTPRASVRARGFAILLRLRQMLRQRALKKRIPVSEHLGLRLKILIAQRRSVRRNRLESGFSARLEICRPAADKATQQSLLNWSW